MIHKVGVTSLLFVGLLAGWSAVDCSELARIIEDVFGKDGRLSTEETIKLCQRGVDLSPSNIDERSKMSVIRRFVKICELDDDFCTCKHKWDIYEKITNIVDPSSSAYRTIAICKKRQQDFCVRSFNLKLELAIASMLPNDQADVLDFYRTMLAFGETRSIKQIADGAARYMLSKSGYFAALRNRAAFNTDFEEYVIPVCENICLYLQSHLSELDEKLEFLDMPFAREWYQLESDCDQLIENQSDIVSRVFNSASIMAEEVSRSEYDSINY